MLLISTTLLSTSNVRKNDMADDFGCFPPPRTEQIVGPEPREATFASSVIRLSCSVAPWPGQLKRSVPLL